MDNELRDNVVEMVRAIRNQNYEETKHMTREEKREHDRKRYTEAKAWMASIKPDPSRFPFLAAKWNQSRNQKVAKKRHSSESGNLDVRL